MLTLVALLLPAGTANAATYCVSNTTELVAALGDAFDDEEPSEIRLRRGSYSTPTPTQSFLYAGGAYDPLHPDQYDLKISGGWQGLSGNCVFQSGSKPQDTDIEGSGSSRLLYIQALHGPMNVEISNLNFLGGSAGPEAAGGAINMILWPQSGEANVLIDRCIFQANTAATGAAIAALARHRLDIRNSIIDSNHSTHNEQNQALSIVGEGDAAIYLINNTITRNLADPATFDYGGARISLNSDASALVVNNIAWDNHAYDLALTGSGDFYLHHNNVGSTAYSTWPTENLGNLSVDPMLGGASRRPLSGSPMINAGREPPTFHIPPIPFDNDWSPGDEDAANRDRIQSSTIDIGAVEYPLNFRNGFE